jgi:ABC-type sugar transport system substrate-binding protein
MPDQIGKIAIEMAAKYFKGETVPPELPVPVKLITLESAKGLAAK